MRTYSRTQNPDKSWSWNLVTTDANGYQDQIYAVTLIQCLKLNLNESPFFGNLGIPGAQAVASQVPPDNYIANIQAYFAPYFASLIITKIPGPGNPQYRANVVFQNGAILTADTLDGWVLTP